MLQPKSAFVDADGVCLHYLEWNPTLLYRSANSAQRPFVDHMDNDTIPIVLLHGLGTTAETWLLVAEHLCQQHQVIAFDLRGHGLSAQPESGYDLTTLAEDIICGMAALGLGQIALVGHGTGARIALVLAARHPALVSHLILVDCPHVEPRHWPDMTRERFISEKLTQDVYAQPQDFLNDMRNEMNSFWSPEIEEILLTYIKTEANGTVHERCQTAHQHLLRESLWEDRALSYYGKLTCPVLLVPAAAQPQHGGNLPEHLESMEDFASAKGYMAQQVARLIRRCTVLWMPEAVHDIQLQHPQQLASSIADFIHT